MSKNIVLCLDRTADFAAHKPTHVFRLFRGLERGLDQTIYYDGGVGTLRDAKEVSWIKKRLGQVMDLAAGFSIREHFIEAYQFLCKNYVNGDRIFVFGFSRGAYTARVLAGAVEKVGILYPEHLNIVPYVWQQLSEVKEMGKDTSMSFNRLKGAFGRSAEIEYMGIWDTVSAFGLGKLRTIPQTSKLDAVKRVRHAVSIDERRSMFPEELVSHQHPNLQEVWFAGVHRDIGGGGREDTLGLSMFSFNWILEEALECELKIDERRKEKMVSIVPNATAPDNSSAKLVALYALAGLIPMKSWDSNRAKHTWKWLNFWRLRPIPAQAYVHRSVKERMEAADSRYRPKNVNVRSIQWFDVSTH